MHARKTAREGAWAGQWAFIFDAKKEATIKSLLPPALEQRSARCRSSATFDSVLHWPS
jgi:hypothetical protein